MISYAGVPLVLDNKELQDWIDTHIEGFDQFWVEDRGPTNQAFAWIERRDIGKPEIGKLYWPNGASRWSVGCFVATGSQLSQILRTTATRPLVLSPLLS